MYIICHFFDMPLKHVFRTSQVERPSQKTLVLELKDGEISGYGEATENSFFTARPEHLKAEIEALSSEIREIMRSGQNPEEAYSILKPRLSNFALCAVDEALHDLYAKKRGISLCELWSLKPGRNIVSSFTIGIDSPENMLAKMQQFPWPIYKIKLGFKDDLALVRNLRRHTDAVFRVDANCAWSPEETIAKSRELKALGVEFIEQPLHPDDDEAMESVYRQSALPVFADESCGNEADIVACKGRFHGINIKLTKCGGLTPARRMIRMARSQGLKILIGCMVESTVGIAAAAQLLPLVDYADIDGALLIQDDPAEGPRVTPEGILYEKGKTVSGTGARLKT